MMKKMETRTWEITLLTPLHIGDGGELQKNLDFLPSGNNLRVIDPEDVLDQLADNPAAIGEMGNIGFDLSRLEKEKHVELKPRYLLPFAGSRPPDNLRRFLKNAHGEPYLAGSTLKGAIRTALWTSLDRHPPPAGQYAGFRKGVRDMEGPDPHHDFLRPLAVSDSVPVRPESSLRAEEIKFFNVKEGDQPGWKDFATRKTFQDFKTAAGLFVEAVRPETRFHVQVRLDDNLTKGPVAKDLKLPACEGLNGFSELARQINRHSRAIATEEQGFFSRYCPATGGARSFYDQLITGIDSLNGADDRFILRMAWGSGWRGMTGDWIEADDLEQVRREENLGRNLCPQCRGQVWGGKDRRKGTYFCRKCKTPFPPNQLVLNPVFPKTRRLAMGGNSPCQPLGWVVVRPVPDDHFRPASVTLAAPAGPAEPDTATKAPPAHEPSGTIASETEVWENVQLTWNPGNQEVTAVGPEKRADGKGKDLIPAHLQTQLFKKKKAIAARVVVSVTGNAVRIEAIE